MTCKLEEALDWQADLVANFELVTNRLKKESLEDAAVVLNHGLLLQFQISTSVHGQQTYTPFTFDMRGALLLRNRIRLSVDKTAVVNIVSAFRRDLAAARERASHVR